MTRTFLGVCAAAALGFTTSIAAQTPTTTTAPKNDEKAMTITGCLEKNKSGGFWLTNAMVAEAGSTGAAATGTTASTTTAETTTGTSGSHAATSAKTFNLEGKDLDKFVGQQVEVMGHPKSGTSGDEVKGTTGPEKEARDFDVKSVKMIASSCR
jgi:hypothetical protein